MKSGKKKVEIRLSEIPIDSSLGLLAYGDIAFTEWRKIKKEKNAEESKKR